MIMPRYVHVYHNYCVLYTVTEPTPVLQCFMTNAREPDIQKQLCVKEVIDCGKQQYTRTFLWLPIHTPLLLFDYIIAVIQKSIAYSVVILHMMS